MFIRKVLRQRSSQSKIFYQYILAQSAGVNGKVKQRVILYLGFDPLFSDKDNQKIVLDKLKLRECLSSVGINDKQSAKALISIVTRALFAFSEHKTAQILESSSELKSLFSYKTLIFDLT